MTITFILWAGVFLVCKPPETSYITISYLLFLTLDHACAAAFVIMWDLHEFLHSIGIDLKNQCSSHDYQKPLMESENINLVVVEFQQEIPLSQGRE